jgi:hypothetical protein
MQLFSQYPQWIGTMHATFDISSESMASLLFSHYRPQGGRGKDGIKG